MNELVGHLAKGLAEEACESGDLVGLKTEAPRSIALVGAHPQPDERLTRLTFGGHFFIGDEWPFCPGHLEGDQPVPHSDFENHRCSRAVRRYLGGGSGATVPEIKKNMLHGFQKAATLSELYV